MTTWRRFREALRRRSPRLEAAVPYPPLSEVSEDQRREFTRRCSTPTASRTCRGSGRQRSARQKRHGRSSGWSSASAPLPTTTLSRGVARRSVESDVYERLYGPPRSGRDVRRGPGGQRRVLVDAALLPPPESDPTPPPAWSRPRPRWGGIVLPAALIGVLLGVALLIVLGLGDGARHRSAPVARAKPKPAPADAPRKQRVRRRHRAPARQSASTQTTATSVPSPPAKALPPMRPARRATTVPPVRTWTAPRQQKAPPRPAYPIPPSIVRSLPSRVRQRLMRARIARSARVWSPAARGRATSWSTRHSSPASSANPTWRGR